MGKAPRLLCRGTSKKGRTSPRYLQAVKLARWIRVYNLSRNRWNKPDGNWKSNLQEVMAVQYCRAIDGLGRIVLPAELLHHLNWEKGKMSVSIEEKDGSSILSSVPATGQTPASPSPVKPQDNPNGQSKIISLPASKKWKNRLPVQ